MRYVIGVDGSTDAVQVIWIELAAVLEPVGVPGTVGAVVSGGWTLMVADGALWALGLLKASSALTV